MLNDDEMNIVLCPESDDTATNKDYKTEAALSIPTETDVKLTEVPSQGKDEENTGPVIPVIENVIFGSEEEKNEECEKQNNVEVDNDNVTKASTSSLRIIFHAKEKNSISSSQSSPNACGAANASQTENVKATNEDAYQCKDEDETAMPVLENEFGSEEEITQRSVMEEKKSIDENIVDGYNFKEANALEEKRKMDDHDHQKEETGNEQARVCDQIGDYSKQETTNVEKQEMDTVLQNDSRTTASTLEVKEGSSGQKKKILKKVEKTGMIFMCSKKTKQDCFDYKVFGLPASKRDVVRKITKGTRLFLFDIGLRVMYGIFKAAAPGDYNVEPNAFKSAFPSQVRFAVLKDCAPLAEEKFRMAIKDNYYRKNMFNCELTPEQVKNLCKLFVAINRGPSLSLKNDDVTNFPHANELSSISIDVHIEGNGGIVKQANSIEEEMNDKNAMVSNKEEVSNEEKIEEAVTEEEKKNEEIRILEANGDDEKSENEGGSGMIFMCSSRTKQDCLHYKVLGLPANKREIVEKVEKGMKLFMFDVDLRLMYGIYKATGPGGYNIEPKAFNSSFPSQVQFVVLKDCPPLTEDKFRIAIKNNYYRKNKFKFQLTSDQVKKLSKLFVSASLSLKQDDVASTSQSKDTLSMSMDMNVEGNCAEVAQADQTEEPINEESAMAGNNEKTNIEKEMKETATEEEKKDENDLIEDPMCSEEDYDEEIASEEGEEEEVEEEEEEEIEEEENLPKKEEEEKEDETNGLATKQENNQEKARKKRKRRREKKPRAGNTGMIFMCSSRTKPDCLHYKVLGLPANKREVVEKIHKGMRLFMFDIELRVLYGIYKAAGPGGYNLEPKAFNSGFPSQVRFTVVKDCLPLEEEKFKVAIKDNYYTKWKFNCELTSEQVKNLCTLFSNKWRNRIRKQRVVPLAQLPPPAHTPMYVSYGNANDYGYSPVFQRHGPPFQPRGWSRHGHSRPY